MANILVIEDDKILSNSLKDLLELNSHIVFEAKDGEEGLEIFNTKKVDLVITDLVLPKKDGLEIIKELKNLNSQTKIIAISAGIENYQNTASLLLPMAKQFGANKVLRKPYNNEELVDALEKSFAI